MAKKKGQTKIIEKTTVKSFVNNPKPKKKRTNNPEKGSKIDKALIENFVALQKVLTNLSIKLDNVANQTSRLLDIFEKSAEALSNREFGAEVQETGRILEGLRNLSEQNKVIARGLTAMHEQKPITTPQQEYQETIMPTTPTQKKSMELEDYEKTISSKLKRLQPVS